METDAEGIETPAAAGLASAGLPGPVRREVPGKPGMQKIIADEMRQAAEKERREAAGEREDLDWGDPF